MIIKEVFDHREIKNLFQRASEYKHRNSGNYKRYDRINNFIKFYTLYDNNNLIAFSGMYKFNEMCVRVLDSTFYFPSIRIKGGNYFGTASEYFLPVMTKFAQEEGYVPFFSIQSDRPHRRSMKRIVQNFNEKNESQYRILNGYHWTCQGQPDQNNVKCWQTVAVCGDYGSSLCAMS